jgi:hypothetical protein
MGLSRDNDKDPHCPSQRLFQRIVRRGQRNKLVTRRINKGDSSLLAHSLEIVGPKREEGDLERFQGQICGCRVSAISPS